MLKLAIVGYGNLGKSLHQLITRDDDAELVALYSRRNIALPLYRPMKELGRQRDFDVALIALGSYADIAQYADALAPLNTVDSFDTHAEIGNYKARLNGLKRDSLAIISTGWDPGQLSLMRGIWGIGAQQCVTLWGEGVSQGHSNALRAIPGVLDAVQFTVPRTDARELMAQGVTASKRLHKRVCYVACVESDKETVQQQITEMPNYFVGYDTEVHFVSQREVRELRQRTHHRGQVICRGEGFEAECTLQLNSNTDYTARVMLAYAKATPRLLADGFRGALDVYDIPLRYLADSKEI